MKGVEREGEREESEEGGGDQGEKMSVGLVYVQPNRPIFFNSVLLWTVNNGVITVGQFFSEFSSAEAAAIAFRITGDVFADERQERRKRTLFAVLRRRRGRCRRHSRRPGRLRLRTDAISDD